MVTLGLRIVGFSSFRGSMDCWDQNLCTYYGDVSVVSLIQSIRDFCCCRKGTFEIQVNIRDMLNVKLKLTSLKSNSLII